MKMQKQVLVKNLENVKQRYHLIAQYVSTKHLQEACAYFERALTHLQKDVYGLQHVDERERLFAQLISDQSVEKEPELELEHTYGELFFDTEPMTKIVEIPKVNRSLDQTTHEKEKAPLSEETTPFMDEHDPLSEETTPFMDEHDPLMCEEKEDVEQNDAAEDDSIRTQPKAPVYVIPPVKENGLASFLAQADASETKDDPFYHWIQTVKEETKEKIKNAAHIYGEGLESLETKTFRALKQTALNQSNAQKQPINDDDVPVEQNIIANEGRETEKK